MYLTTIILSRLAYLTQAKVIAYLKTKGERMKRIVVTGGPCAGKTTVIETLRTELGTKAVFVPECATLILSGGFPAPPDQEKLGIERFHTWQRHFQSAIYHIQLALEDLADIEAKFDDTQFVIHDRGIADGIAYHPEGLAGFMSQLHTNGQEIFERYDAVVFLESLAVKQPELFGKLGNEHRYESVDTAVRVNTLTHNAWKLHPNFHYIGSTLPLEDKAKKVREIISSS